MSCMSPCAPAPEPALGLKLDSCLITARTSDGSTPYLRAAPSISAENGVAAPGPVAAPAAPTPVATSAAPTPVVAPAAPVASAGWPPAVAWSSALAKLVVPCAGGAGVAPGASG